MGKKNKKTKSSRPVPLKGMIEDQLYIYTRHGYGKIYKKEGDTLYFLMREEKDDFQWSPTMVDETTAKFFPLNLENFLGKLQKEGHFHARK